MIRLSTGRAALFGAMLAAALVLFLPMRLALGLAGVGEAGLSARSADGSVWAGTLSEARAGDLPLGDLRARLSPLDLLVGRAKVALRSRGHAPEHPLAGAVLVSRHGLGIDGVTASLPAAGLFAPLPVTTLDLDDVTARFRDGECQEASGRVRATLAGDMAGVPLGGELAGPARCDVDGLLLALASPAGSPAVNLRLWPDGRYTAQVVLSPSDSAGAARLAAMGFQQGAGGYQLLVTGRF